ncbi:hypothetical protein ES703_115257 [subsurface metagenome]
MAPKYGIGQKVVITPAKDQLSSLRDSDLEPFAGRVGEIANYHWLSGSQGEVFYIYTVKLETDYKEVVLHEDELEAFVA